MIKFIVSVVCVDLKSEQFGFRVFTEKHSGVVVGSPKKLIETRSMDSQVVKQTMIEAGCDPTEADKLMIDACKRATKMWSKMGCAPITV